MGRLVSKNAAVNFTTKRTLLFLAPALDNISFIIQNHEICKHAKQNTTKKDLRI